ncbi:MAG TPA: arsenate reductase ArsC [Gaiellaceae bacterium]|jgi:protein-tyrosine-phosphatase
MTRILFICVANSGRSVMAERILRDRFGDAYESRSAGSDPGTATHPIVVEVLREIGIDASDHVPRKLDDEAIDWADVVVSTCGEEACPVTPPGTKRIYWNLPDPKNEPIEHVREIRDEIARRVEQLTSDRYSDRAQTPPA